MSMALMTFLICTVVASVTLTAATAVVGRQKGFVEANQNYYLATSAAKVFWDELADNKIQCKIRRSYTVPSGATTGTWSMSLDNCGSAYVDGSEDHQLTLNSDPSNPDASIFEVLTADALFLMDSSLRKTDKSYTTTISPSDVQDSMTVKDTDLVNSTPNKLNYKDNEADYEPIKVNVGSDTDLTVQLTVKRMANGDYRFGFKKASSSADAEKIFKVSLIARADIDNSIGHTSRNLKDDSVTYYWDTTVTWKRVSLDVGGA